MKCVVGMLMIVVGLINEFVYVNWLIEVGDVDFVVMVCVMLYDLCWLWYVVVEFGV